MWTAPECVSSLPIAGASPKLQNRGHAKSFFKSGPTADPLASDVYSFGVVVYECLSRREPFEGHDPWDIVAGVASGSLRLPTPPGCSAEIGVLLSECLSFEPARRPPISEVERRLAALDPSQVTSDALAAAKEPDASMYSRMCARRRELFEFAYGVAGKQLEWGASRRSRAQFESGRRRDGRVVVVEVWMCVRYLKCEKSRGIECGKQVEGGERVAVDEKRGRATVLYG
jgi:serine/threonine protein kinase